MSQPPEEHRHGPARRHPGPRQPAAHARGRDLGSGFAGLAAAIALSSAAGVADLVILEKADAVGGTWRENPYPGCACDVPSHLYSFSFEPNPQWSRYSPQRDPRPTCAHCADVRPAAAPALRRALPRRACDEAPQRWRVAPPRHELTARGAHRRHGPLRRPGSRAAGARALRRPGLSLRAVGPRRTTSPASGWR